jgi:hypothetical protein
VGRAHVMRAIVATFVFIAQLANLLLRSQARGGYVHTDLNTQRMSRIAYPSTEWRTIGRHDQEIGARASLNSAPGAATSKPGRGW